MASALERVLADVKPVPLAAPVLSLEQQQQEGVFNNANAALQPAVYYSPDAYKALDALYADLLQATAASVPVPEVKKGCSASAPDTQLDCMAVTWMQSLHIAQTENWDINTKSCVWYIGCSQFLHERHSTYRLLRRSSSQ